MRVVVAGWGARRGVWLAAAFAVGCGGGRPDCAPAPGSDAPIVLLVTVDTLRADHADGSPVSPARTPALDRLAVEGVRFTQAYAAANVTLPSHLSLLASQAVATHRVLDNHVVTGTPRETIASRLGAAGYRAAAFVGAFHLGPRMALGAVLGGLERFEGPDGGRTALVASEPVDRAIAWLAAGACRGPAFAWVHLWDPHMPYAPPPPFDRAYYAGDPRDARATSMAEAELDWGLYDVTGSRQALRRSAGAFRQVKRVLGVGSTVASDVVLHPERLDALGVDAAAAMRAIRTLQGDLRRRLPYQRSLAGFLTGVTDVAYPRALYAGEVSYVDRELGRLRDALDDFGIASRAILVVTSDHGEGLGEHGVFFNHLGLWEEMIRVPLVVWAPGRLEPGVRADLAGGLDVGPTLLGLVGVAPAASMEGRDLFGAAPSEPVVVVEADEAQGIALRSGAWKLIRSLTSTYVNGAFHRRRGDVELYDLSTDRGERANQAAVRPDVRQALSSRLDAWLAQRGIAPDGTGYAVPAAPVPADVRQRLRELGYVE